MEIQLPFPEIEEVSWQAKVNATVTENIRLYAEVSRLNTELGELKAAMRVLARDLSRLAE